MHTLRNSFAVFAALPNPSETDARVTQCVLCQRTRRRCRVLRITCVTSIFPVCGVVDVVVALLLREGRSLSVFSYARSERFTCCNLLARTRSRTRATKLSSLRARHRHATFERASVSVCLCVYVRALACGAQPLALIGVVAVAALPMCSRAVAGEITHTRSRCRTRAECVAYIHIKTWWRMCTKNTRLVTLLRVLRCCLLLPAAACRRCRRCFAGACFACTHQVTKSAYAADSS